MLRWKTTSLILAGLLLAAPVFAQGNPTGTISGHIVDASGLVVPGVTVSAESPALQGVRTTTSTANGDYLLPFLPAGQYVLTFELQGFRTLKVDQGVAAAQTYPLNVALAIAPVNETVQVSGKAANISQTAVAATTVAQSLLEMLPTTRTVNAAALLAPSVKDTGPLNAITIQGAFSYESLFLVNGVVVNENLRGQPTTPYVEDALEETTVLTSGVSAEYGRFAGGVVNAITKSGGNTFSGSFRDSFANDSWRTLTPYAGDKKVGKTVPMYEMTLGGPVVKDRLWFFGAGRFRDASNATTGVTTATNLPYAYGTNEKRGEGKLTWSPNASNTVRGSYAHVSQTDVNNWYTGGPILDLASLYTRQSPQSLVSLNYTGIVTPRFFVEGQFSRRDLTIQGSGAPTTDLIRGTLLLDQSRGNARYWSPTFCGVCSDEQRDNQNVIVKGTYFLSTPAAGSHTMVFGVDNFRDERLANNHQSGSDYRVYGTRSIIAADGTVFPVFDSRTVIQYNPIPVTSQGNDFQTWSAFYNDAWQLSNRLTVNAGLRWDRNDGADQTGAVVVRDSAFSPRLGASWDPTGAGTWTVTGSYARYVTSIANSIGDAGSSAGNAATYQWFYGGPAINTAGAGVGTADALKVLFDWFNGQGGPNTKTLPLIGVDVPGVATRLAGTLVSPSTHEFAAGVARQLGAKGAFRADFTYRKATDFYSTRTDVTTGHVTNSVGDTFDVNIVENTNDVKRQYAGVALQTSYRLPRTQVGGNWTISRTWGNFNGENPNGPLTAGPAFYPEYIAQSWDYPSGDLSTDQRHRVRAWVMYDFPVRDTFGTLQVSALENFATGTPYGAVGVVNSSAYVAAAINSQYVTPMGGAGVPYYFSARDAYRTANDQRLDLALNYGHRLGVGKAQLFAQLQLINAFNQFALSNARYINTTVLTRSNTAALQAFDPFSAAPVAGTNYSYGPLWQQATNKDAYTTPRTFRFSVGIRF